MASRTCSTRDHQTADALGLRQGDQAAAALRPSPVSVGGAADSSVNSSWQDTSSFFSASSGSTRSSVDEEEKDTRHSSPIIKPSSDAELAALSQTPGDAFSLDDLTSLGSDYSPSMASVKQAVLLPRRPLGEASVDATPIKGQSHHHQQQQHGRPTSEQPSHSPANSLGATPVAFKLRHSASASMSSTGSSNEEALLPPQAAFGAAAAAAETEGLFGSSSPRRGQRMQSILAPKMKIHGPAPWALEDEAGEQQSRDASVEMSRSNASIITGGPEEELLDMSQNSKGKKGLAVKGLDLTKSLLKRTPPTSPQPPSPLPPAASTQAQSRNSPRPSESVQSGLSGLMGERTDITPTPDEGRWQLPLPSPSRPDAQASPACSSSSPRLPGPGSRSPRLGASLPGSPRPMDSSSPVFATCAVDSSTPLGPASSSSGSTSPARHPLKLISLEDAQAQERQKYAGGSSPRKSFEPVEHQAQQQGAPRTLKNRKSGFLKLFGNKKDEEAPPPVPPRSPGAADQSFASSSTTNGDMAPSLGSSNRNKPAPPPPASPNARPQPRSAPATQVSFGPAPKINPSDRLQVNNNNNNNNNSNNMNHAAPSLNLRPVSMAFSDNFSQDMLLKAAAANNNNNSGNGKSGTDEAPLPSPTTSASRSDAASIRSAGSVYDAAGSSSSSYPRQHHHHHHHQSFGKASSASTAPTSPGFTQDSRSVSHGSSLHNFGPGSSSAASISSSAGTTKLSELEQMVVRLEKELDATRKERDAALARICTKSCEHCGCGSGDNRSPTLSQSVLSRPRPVAPDSNARDPLFGHKI